MAQPLQSRPKRPWGNIDITHPHRQVSVESAFYEDYKKPSKFGILAPIVPDWGSLVLCLHCS